MHCRTLRFTKEKVAYPKLCGIFSPMFSRIRFNRTHIQNHSASFILRTDPHNCAIRSIRSASAIGTSPEIHYKGYMIG
jgi:hypothetical protein